MANTETEVKIKVSDLDAIAQQLESLGAVRTHDRTYEKNVRYEDANQSLTPADRVLRLRQDDQVRLTYKEPTESTGRFKTRTEIEVTVGDFDTTELLLQKLGYHPAWVYEKYRTTFTLGNCEIVLDEMPYGALIEIEGDTVCIESALTRLGLHDAPPIHASYSDLFFAIKAKLGLSFRDLTFENFAGIAVPEAIFTQAGNNFDTTAS
jgi:adenylate cyclase class 2